MKPSDVFGVVVRTIGVLCLLYGAWCAAVWLQFALGFSEMLPSAVRLQAVFLLAAGLGALRGADHVVGFAYPAAGVPRTRAGGAGEPAPAR
ncbi:MAG: hypothetical protein DCC67_10660 [Planctomycetota bacterium]|nr:MAG: hypothetical protein DCC67_10660 [Planctomycetota bacterium]